MKRVSKVLLLCVCLVATERFAHQQTKGFQLHKIYANLPETIEQNLFNSEEDTTKALDLLQQKYSFLDSGRECYAFISEDRSTVLKLFKLHHMNYNHWIQKIPLPQKLAALRTCLTHDPEKRRKKFVNSYRIAHLELKEETGLIFTHLVKTDNLHQTITVIDPLHIEHHIQADQVEFVLQKKATKAFPYFESLFAAGHNERGKACIDSLISLIETKHSKQIFDHDPVLDTNIAFVDDHVVEIDVGSFSRREGKVNRKKELKELDNFKSWLEIRDRDLADYLEAKMISLKESESI